MSPSTLEQETRLQLIQQLVYFDEEKLHFLDRYYPEQDQKRRMVEKAIEEYAAFLNGILEKSGGETLHSVALIGSQVELRYLDDGSTESYTIVFPEEADPAKGRVSFLSPVGFQLLMARRSDVLQLALPFGETSVQVEKVEFARHVTVSEE